MDIHAVLDAAIALVEKANQIGIAAETALKAFHERLFPEPHEGLSGSAPAAYGSLPTRAQEAVDEAVKSAQQS